MKGNYILLDQYFVLMEHENEFAKRRQMVPDPARSLIARVQVDVFSRLRVGWNSPEKPERRVLPSRAWPRFGGAHRLDGNAWVNRRRLLL